MGAAYMQVDREGGVRACASVVVPIEERQLNVKAIWYRRMTTMLNVLFNKIESICHQKVLEKEVDGARPSMQVSAVRPNQTTFQPRGAEAREAR